MANINYNIDDILNALRGDMKENKKAMKTLQAKFDDFERRQVMKAEAVERLQTFKSEEFERKYQQQAVEFERKRHQQAEEFERKREQQAVEFEGKREQQAEEFERLREQQAEEFERKQQLRAEEIERQTLHQAEDRIRQEQKIEDIENIMQELSNQLKEILKTIGTMHTPAVKSPSLGQRHLNSQATVGPPLSFGQPIPVSLVTNKPTGTASSPSIGLSPQTGLNQATSRSLTGISLATTGTWNNTAASGAVLGLTSSLSPGAGTTITTVAPSPSIQTGKPFTAAPSGMVSKPPTKETKQTETSKDITEKQTPKPVANTKVLGATDGQTPSFSFTPNQKGISFGTPTSNTEPTVTGTATSTAAPSLFGTPAASTTTASHGTFNFGGTSGFAFKGQPEGGTTTTSASRNSVASMENISVKSLVKGTPPQGFTQTSTQTPPKAAPKAAPVVPKGQSIADKFKMKAGEWESDGCLVRNKLEVDKCLACGTAKPEAKPKAAQEVSSTTVTPQAKGGAQSISAMFKLKAGTWSCDMCLVQNNDTSFRCVACNTPKPGATPKKVSSSTSSEKGGAFTFGAKSGSGGSGLTFDVASTPTPAASGESFTLPSTASASQPSANQGFVLGGASGVPSFDKIPFGDVDSSSKDTPQKSQPPDSSVTPSSGCFLFGTSTSFSFTGVTSPKSPGEPEYYENSDEEDNIHFEPIVPLPDKVDIKTGEEEENALFSHRSKLYRFTDGQWKERGIGDINILEHKVSKRRRLLMRREHVLKVCLNHYLTTDLELKPMPGGKGNSWVWHADDFSEDELKHEQFAIKFKDESIANDFKEAFDAGEGKSTEVDQPIDDSVVVKETKQESKPVSKGYGESPKTSDHHSEKKDSIFKGFTVNSTLKSGNDDVIFVKEKKPTPDQLSRARALMLPDSFYFYEEKEDCPGCIGCTDGDWDAIKASSDDPFTGKSASSETFSFKGAGATLFGGKVKTTADREENSDDDDGVPLPELVEVKTGEENDEVLFSHRSKIFVFVSKSNQWKERGIGKIKILKNTFTGKCRVLQRREQVLKLSCNHAITLEMKLKPMNTAENAWCWNALDFAESEPRQQQFAVRFKFKETADMFQSVFENYQKSLAATVDDQTSEQGSDLSGKSSPTSTGVSSSNSQVSSNTDQNTVSSSTGFSETTSVSSTSAVTKTESSAQSSSVKEAEELTEGEEDYETEEEEEDEVEVIFTKRVTMFYKVGDDFEKKGLGDLLITHDNDLDVFRIEMSTDKDEKLCNHIICREQRLHVPENKKFGEWKAVDFSTDEAIKRHFRVEFSSQGAVEEFQTMFDQGVGLARESEVSEASDYQIFM